MEFRPCIDIHDGKVKQIVGGSLSDEKGTAVENFVSERGADYYATFYKEEGLSGGHIIMLNTADSPYYEKTKQQAFLALSAFPGGLQIGGGIRAENLLEFLNAGATHGIVTSYVFSGGKIRLDRLKKLCGVAGKERVVLDLSCRKKGGAYYVVTDRWQKFTEEKVTPLLLANLSDYCDEFLIHAADVEGKQVGMEEELLGILAEYEGLPITYAGGIRSLGDIDRLYVLGRGKVNFTIGSALDLFGGELRYEDVKQKLKEL